MQNKKISLEQLTDIVGFRILLNSIQDCYKTLGILHSKYSAILTPQGKFLFDFIVVKHKKGYLESESFNELGIFFLSPFLANIEAHLVTFGL